MRIKGNTIVLLSVVTILLLVFSSLLFAQEERKIKMDEYKVQLTGEQTREVEANQKIQTLQTEIDNLKNQISDTQGKIDATWGEVYGLLGVDKASVNAFRGDLNSIGSQLDGLSALSPEELFERREELEALEERVANAKENKISWLTEMENKLADLDAKIANLKVKMPANLYDQYTVLKGDYLWKISKKEDIYDDAYQWIRIYSVNKDQIKDPDLVFPEQVLNIARGVGKNEYLVQGGDWLSKIASSSEIYNDPTKWTKLYEANKDAILTDPNLIFPHQVLTIPKE